MVMVMVTVIVMLLRANMRMRTKMIDYHGDEEENYDDDADTAADHDDAESRVVVPPSQVAQSRGGQPIKIAPGPSFGTNSLLASGSGSDISHDGTAGNKSVGSRTTIKSQGSNASSYYIKRTLRPAKTVAL